MPEDAYRSDRWGRLATAEDFAHAAHTLDAVGRHPSEAAARAAYLALLDLRPGQSVLEVGAGTGVIARDAARRVAPSGRMAALDAFEPLLAIARADAARAGLSNVLETHCADARDLPFADRSFDAAYCHWLLIHLAPATKVVREMMRVTRAGGRVLCVEADWETAAVHPGERSVTRRILNTCCDRHLDGWMGRKLADLMRGCGLAEVTVHPIVCADEGRDGDAWFAYVRSRADVALAAGAITPAECDAWLEMLDAAYTRGGYLFSVTQFATVGLVR